MILLKVPQRWATYYAAMLPLVVLAMKAAHASEPIVLQSPSGENEIRLETCPDENAIKYSVRRRGKQVIEPSAINPIFVRTGSLADGAQITSVQREQRHETFHLPWGKTASVANRSWRATIELQSRINSEGPAKAVHWAIELIAYDDGVAFRYRIADPIALGPLREESTEFRPADNPQVLFNTLDGFTTSHESLYEHKPFSELPNGRLIDMPMLLTWPNGTAAAITEARVLQFAGMYLERPKEDDARLVGRLSPLPSDKEAAVIPKPPLESPWRVVLLGESAGKLLESNLLLCLNDPPQEDFTWVRPGKTTFHWWNGELEDYYNQTDNPGAYLAKHKEYIDFCAANHIAYHAVSGDGRSWYVQSDTSYATPGDDADVCTARPEIELPKIIEYGRQRGVGIRLWVHWKPLSAQLEKAFALYESWGVKGLMVDFLDRDDQEMIDFTERMLTSAARHKLHIQIHGSSKYSGEQRTFPNLFNREGVLNLEYLKWGDPCSPDHSVNVAYTRALAGPVDYHLGGFHAMPRETFKPQERNPVILGTRCNQLALYVVYENPMPMVADTPQAYKGQAGFEFLREVPVSWDETRFLRGDPGEYVVLARRSGKDWYLGGITNWTSREIDVPLSALGQGNFAATLFTDGADPANPNAVVKKDLHVNTKSPLRVSMASGGGFAAILKPE